MLYILYQQDFMTILSKKPVRVHLSMLCYTLKLPNIMNKTMYSSNTARSLFFKTGKFSISFQDKPFNTKVTDKPNKHSNKHHVPEPYNLFVH